MLLKPVTWVSMPSDVLRMDGMIFLLVPHFTVTFKLTGTAFATTTRLLGESSIFERLKSTPRPRKSIFERRDRKSVV